MLHKKKSIRQQRLALCLLALLVLLPTGESAAEFPAAHRINGKIDASAL